jgi:hypothetical protein
VFGKVRKKHPSVNSLLVHAIFGRKYVHSSIFLKSNHGQARSRLLDLSVENAKNLDLIEKSLFCLSLDDMPSPTMLNEAFSASLIRVVNNCRL